MFVKNTYFSTKASSFRRWIFLKVKLATDRQFNTQDYREGQRQVVLGRHMRLVVKAMSGCKGVVTVVVSLR